MTNQRLWFDVESEERWLAAGNQVSFFLSHQVMFTYDGIYRMEKYVYLISGLKPKARR